MLFPRDVFKAIGPRGFASLLCHTRADYDRALTDGFFATVPEALAASRGSAPAKAPPKPASVAPAAAVVEPVAVDESRPSRAELEEEARKLGVKLDSRNSDERLAERILEALKA